MLWLLRHVKTEKPFAPTWEKDKTVEFSDSLVNNEATTKKKKINATTFVRYLKFTPGMLLVKITLIFDLVFPNFFLATVHESRTQN